MSCFSLFPEFFGIPAAHWEAVVSFPRDGSVFVSTGWFRLRFYGMVLFYMGTFAFNTNSFRRRSTSSLRIFASGVRLKR